ncbi:hypothetical protein ANO11243_029660 [Dothideomycetidae sp. 11243]|nr:hypothetical protein ANO11243_029660 [fungal sp. No.11243]
MSGRGRGGGGKVLLPPINAIFQILQRQQKVSIWLYEQTGLRIEGFIKGFDEFMNLVIEDATEVKLADKKRPEESRRKLGRILLKGDNVSLIQNIAA